MRRKYEQHFIIKEQQQIDSNKTTYFAPAMFWYLPGIQGKQNAWPFISWIRDWIDHLGEYNISKYFTIQYLRN